MKVRMNENLATPTGQFTMGMEYDIDDAEAVRLVEGGIATDPTGKVTRKESAAPSATRQTLDRDPSKPLEKLPSSLPLAGHPYKDPAASSLATGNLVTEGQAAGGLAATNAPTAEETREANEQLAPLSESQPGDSPEKAKAAKKK